MTAGPSSLHRAPRKERPLLFNRFALRLSKGRRFDGLWIGTFLEDEPERILRHVEEALALIKAHDRLRYDRLVRDLERVWVRLLPGSLGNYDRTINACQLDTRFVLAETSGPEQIAAAIVHEATHARLFKCGIGYPVELRSRVEAVCVRRELAFAAKLPNGEQVRELAERRLLMCTVQDTWTNAAFTARHLKGSVATLHYLGCPEWVVQAVLKLNTLRLKVRRFFRSTTDAPPMRH
jgi:hypothetical protein